MYRFASLDSMIWIPTFFIVYLGAKFIQVTLRILNYSYAASHLCDDDLCLWVKLKFHARLDLTKKKSTFLILVNKLIECHFKEIVKYLKKKHWPFQSSFREAFLIQNEGKRFLFNFPYFFKNVFALGIR